MLVTENTIGAGGFEFSPEFPTCEVRSHIKFFIIEVSNNEILIDGLADEAWLQVMIGGKRTGPILTHTEIHLPLIQSLKGVDMNALCVSFLEKAKQKVAFFEENEDHNDLIGYGYADLEEDINLMVLNSLPTVCKEVLDLEDKLIQQYIATHTNLFPVKH